MFVECGSQVLCRTYRGNGVARVGDEAFELLSHIYLYVLVWRCLVVVCCGEVCFLLVRFVDFPSAIMDCMLYLTMSLISCQMGANNEVVRCAACGN